MWELVKYPSSKVFVPMLIACPMSITFSIAAPSFLNALGSDFVIMWSMRQNLIEESNVLTYETMQYLQIDKYLNNKAIECKELRRGGVLLYSKTQCVPVD